MVASFSKKIKQNVKKAVKFISDFETTAAELAIEKGYHYVICGHIHEPKTCHHETTAYQHCQTNSHHPGY